MNYFIGIFFYFPLYFSCSCHYCCSFCRCNTVWRIWEYKCV